MEILVTGGSGFIGTNLVESLIETGHNITIYDTKKSRAYPDHFFEGDVCDQKKLSQACENKQLVYHLAAEHADNVSPISLYYDVNVGGAKNLVAACEENGINHIIFTSTVALYGLDVSIPNENSPAQPFNDYGKSKYEAEKILIKWAERDSSRKLIIIRPVVIFGENNRGNVYNFIRQVSEGKFVMVGNGKNKKSMGYVKNFVSFLNFILKFGPGIHIFNYVDKPDLETKTLLLTVNKALGRKPSSLYLPYILGLAGGKLFDFLSILTGKKFPISAIRVKKFCADTQVSSVRLQEAGFTPPYPLEEGLTKMVEYEFGKSTIHHPYRFDSNIK